MKNLKKLKQAFICKKGGTKLTPQILENLTTHLENEVDSGNDFSISTVATWLRDTSGYDFNGTANVIPASKTVAIKALIKLGIKDAPIKKEVVETVESSEVE